jgi:hypothetical protein
LENGSAFSRADLLSIIIRLKRIISVGGSEK